MQPNRLPDIDRLALLRQRIVDETARLVRRTAVAADTFERLAQVRQGARADRLQTGATKLWWLAERCSDHLVTLRGLDFTPSAPEAGDLPIGSAPEAGDVPMGTPTTTPATRMVDDVVDPASDEVARGSAFARALVTARGDADLGPYLDLLAELRNELLGPTVDGSGDAGDETGEARRRADFVLGLVGGLSLVAAVTVRSAERSGLRTESGQPLLAELFERLSQFEARL